jgi:hypothetical protein
VKSPYEIIRHKESRLRELEAESGKLRLEIDALRLAAQLMMEEGDAKPETDELSAVGMARRILSDVGAPMSTNEIRTAIRARYGKDIPRNILSSDFFRNFRAKDRFFRKGPQPGTWALLAWPDDDSSVSFDDGELGLPLNGKP